MIMQIFHFSVEYAYLREGKRVFSFASKPKISKQQSWTQNQRQAALSKIISLFWKQSKGKESLFLKEKTSNTLYAYALYFSIFLKA